MLQFDGVTFAYEQSGKNNILNETTLMLQPGRTTVITGASGCGKSTLLYLAAGLYPKNAGILKSGLITVDGRDVSQIPPEQRAHVVGMMFQNPDLQFCMDTVRHELAFCLENVQIPPDGMDAIIQDALAFCGITHLKDRRLVTLSGGEKQRAMLACVVALNPKWLLLDEPFANLDPASAVEIAQELKRLQTERNWGIVAVDHHLDHWLSIADEIIVLERGGRIALRGVTPQDLPMEQLDELGVSVPSFAYQITKPPKQPEQPQAVLSLRNVSVSAGGKPVIRDCSADFYKGRIHAVTGASGSGKSTLFGTLCRLHSYTGNIELHGQELRRIPRRNMGHKLGFVFQNPQDQFVAGNVLDELRVGLRAVLSPEDVDTEAERILRDTGLWRYRFVSPYMLSQGQQRRLAVAALLAYQCDILVCDEPTYAQDRRSLLAVMDELQQKVLAGLTLIFSTHDHKLAHDYADIIYALKEGQLHAIHQSGL